MEKQNSPYLTYAQIIAKNIKRGKLNLRDVESTLKSTYRGGLIYAAVLRALQRM